MLLEGMTSFVRIATVLIQELKKQHSYNLEGQGI